MNRQCDILQRAAMDAELPGETLSRAPIVEILGNYRVLIENHHGVTGYCCTEISVCTNCGIYYIRGKTLQIARMTKYQLVITGIIEGVSLGRVR